MTKQQEWVNKLYYGDNLEVLRRHVADESIDLVYLDPPFNSNRSYSLLFKEKSGAESQAQVEAFDDTWTWTHETQATYLEILNGSVPNQVKDAIESMRRLLGDNDVLAYLVMMTTRLVELRRVLKPTGSLYLHCDPTASHYLKAILDAVFGVEQFRNEIIWQRSTGKSLSTRRLPNNHDVILAYAPSDSPQWYEDAVFAPYDEDNLDEKTASKYRNRDSDGRLYQLDSLINPNRNRPNLTYEFLGVTRVWRWTRERMEQAYDEGLIVQPKPGRVPRLKRYLDEQRGRPLGDVWTDIPPINSRAAERLGYPTQKPLSLLERIVGMTTQPGDVVLDPFAGCGTTVDAAEKLSRRWIGIDVTTLAIDLIDARMRRTYGEGIRNTYEIRGIPRDHAGATALFEYSPLEFERWCVMLVDGQPNERQVGDRGIDGVIRFPLDAKGNSERVLVSVKGGTTSPGDVRDLVGTVHSQRAAMGLLICMNEPTARMKEAANHSGLYTYPVNHRKYPKVQIITVSDLLNGERAEMPTTLLPYFEAKKREETVEQPTLDGL